MLPGQFNALFSKEKQTPRYFDILLNSLLLSFFFYLKMYLKFILTHRNYCGEHCALMYRNATMTFSVTFSLVLVFQKETLTGVVFIFIPFITGNALFISDNVYCILFKFKCREICNE